MSQAALAKHSVKQQSATRKRFNVILKKDLVAEGKKMATARDLSFSRQIERLLARELRTFHRSQKLTSK